ncbi:MAG: aromatic hydrocarbon degradation protein [Gammaproteobacteria bacterium HGW-Gammaproteobacteria-9]|nr:MAG: aromatic hydrocarbon degradation protein [Gammaproteobacteria bacterium HGW-Gammaproteobacteria-9]
MQVPNRWLLHPLVVACIVLGVHTPAMAGGLILYEVGTDNVGLANAGAAARAQDPGTMLSNVAGLSYLEGAQLTLGAQLLYGDMEFSPDANTNVPGSSSGNIIGWMPGGSLFVSRQLDERWTVGFASYGDFGLGIDYDDGWSGRYYMQNATLMGITFMPSVAYRINDNWSVGAGLRVMYALMNSELAVDNNPAGYLSVPDGEMTYEDDDIGYGTSLGLIYQPQEGTRIGLSYTSAIDLEFKDRFDPEGLRPGVADALASRGILGATTQISMEVPQTLTLSLYHQLDPAWAILASVGWQDWSNFGEVGIQLDSGDPVDTTLDANYDDTWHLSLGTQYRMSPKLLWSAGVAYDSSPVSDRDRTLSMPIGETWRFATGVTYALDRNSELNLSYALAWMGDMEVSQSKRLPLDDPKTVSGSFDNSLMHAFSGSMTWRF